MSNYVCAIGDDWSGIYVNDELVMEGHTIHSNDVFSIIQEYGLVESYEMKYIDQDWLENTGNLPANIFDVKFEQ